MATKASDLTEIMSSFVPPLRFSNLTFDQYRPNPDYLSQNNALIQLKHFVTQLNRYKHLLFFRKPKIKSIYLDGSFGVGKTHLLTATWQEIKGIKYYFSFADLVFFIGSIGINQAIEYFNGCDFIAIDEFELDDPGNTLIIATFLGSLIKKGAKVMATSNTIPGKLGEGRFNAADFKREIATLASYFSVITIDGPDYRHRELQKSPQPLTESDFYKIYSEENRSKLCINFDDLSEKLAKLHPAHFGQLITDIKIIFIKDLATVKLQDSALRLVHFVDKLYENKVYIVYSGCDLSQLFDESYKFGAYAKKYGRCLSRLTESVIKLSK